MKYAQDLGLLTTDNAFLTKKYQQNSKILNRIDKKYSEFMNLCHTNLFNRSLKTIKKDRNLLHNLNTHLKIDVDIILCFGGFYVYYV